VEYEFFKRRRDPGDWEICKRRLRKLISRLSCGVVYYRWECSSPVTQGDETASRRSCGNVGYSIEEQSGPSNSDHQISLIEPFTTWSSSLTYLAASSERWRLVKLFTLTNVFCVKQSAPFPVVKQQLFWLAMLDVGGLLTVSLRKGTFLPRPCQGSQSVLMKKHGIRWTHRRPRRLDPQLGGPLVSPCMVAFSLSGNSTFCNAYFSFTLASHPVHLPDVSDASILGASHRHVAHTPLAAADTGRGSTLSEATVPCRTLRDTARQSQCRCLHRVRN
jgi:hypothetical protein